ncbi:hypothetical protein EVG20_g2392 [Dentipellis fragilis]|uniref:CID domain-containing protein n=1 Tax=Dentipellis fragilis TaxID=205917 RepID=A0A4Y9Z7A3_9AGAM|nr:hypothetical protein EVG20_g2392 [Dentipellis fragilis]
MDKTKTKLAAFFDQDDEESSFPQKQVDDHKLSQYAQGTVRKSRREKEKEAAEAKKREEEEHAARAYAEFIDAFEGEDAGKKKTSAFVRPSTESGEVYTPSLATQGKAAAGSSRTVRAFEQSRSPSPSLGPKPKGKRAMDAFLEEIKRDQADREARFSRSNHARSATAMAAYEGQSGSKDRGDPETTNLFVANLPPHVTEPSLGMFFARCGPVGSVKVMWPRSDATHGPGADMTATRRNKNAGLSGFVSFLRRKDAEAALREFDGFDWGGSVLRVGWSKAVPIAPKPMYVRNKSRSHSRERGSHSPSRDRRRSSSRDRFPPSSRRPRSRSYSRSRSRSRSPDFRDPRRPSSRSHYDRRSRSPRGHRSSYDGARDGEGDDITDDFIRMVALEVRGHGDRYEWSLKEREKNNPKYAFLTNERHRRHRYYRSLVDSRQDIEPEFEDEGYNSIYSTDSAEESERERTRKTKLGKYARKRFESMLRALSGTRGELARCMAFSLEHAEAANEVADIIISSLIVDGTPVPRKISRLYLICDILHNSAAPLPMAWKFRQEFQSRLGLVFDHFSTIYHSFPGRITAETFKKQIMAVVDIWEDWIVFSPEFTAELKQRIEGHMQEEAPVAKTPEVVVKEAEREAPSRFKASSFKPAEVVAEAPAKAKDDVDGEPMDEGSDVDGVPLEDIDGVPLDDDVDGLPLDDDMDGVPMDDIDGAPLDNVDGVPMQESDVDGEPMEDDVDGVPLML